MKKTLMSVMAMAIVLVSCGNKQAGNLAQEDSLQVPVEEVATAEDDLAEAIANPENQAEKLAESLSSALESKDAKTVTSVLESATQKIQQLIEAGQTEAAEIYANKIKGYVDAAAEQLNGIGVNESSINGFISSVNDAAADAAKTVTESTNEAIEKAKDAGNAVVEGAKSKIQETVEGGKDAAKAATSEAVNKAVDDVKQKANDALKKAFGE